VAMAQFITLLPREESPEQTKGRQGFYYLASSSGAMEQSECLIALRDFDAAENQRRVRVLEDLARTVMSHFPGLVITVDANHSYANMAAHIAKHPRMLEVARAAIRDAGLEPTELPIRGGTDGSRLSEMGHPTPNLFAGGMLFHSRLEWIAVSALNRAAETLVHLVHRWATTR